jgi:peptidoglycan/xylan/chitin deacetylase (PgdA/CDA1 family)
MTATFFVLAGRLGGPYHLGGDDLQSLVRAGMTIGSHGLHHRDWRRIGDGELTRELVESRQILERVTGQRVTRASVPFGSYDRHVLARLRRDGGYDRVFTSDGGAARPDAWLQARTSVTAGDSAATLASPAHVARAVAAHRAVKRVVKRWR